MAFPSIGWNIEAMARPDSASRLPLWSARSRTRTSDLRMTGRWLVRRPRPKSVYCTRYDDLADAFARARIDQVSLEYCTLSYNMLTLWDKWKFKGEFAVGVVDQRSDSIETPEIIGQRSRPVLEYFDSGKLLLSSECGFQHVPLDITRRKLQALVAGARWLRHEVTQ